MTLPYPHLDCDAVSAIVSTGEAAASLNRRPQTLRKWACLECGPLRPIRINGRLGWRVADIQQLLQGKPLQIDDQRGDA